MDETLPKGRHTPSISSQSESGLGIDNLEHDSHAPAVEVTDASDQRRLLSPNSTYMPSPASPYQAEHLRNGLQLSPSWQSTMSTPDGGQWLSALTDRLSRLMLCSSRLQIPSQPSPKPARLWQHTYSDLDDLRFRLLGYLARFSDSRTALPNLHTE